MCFCKHKNCLQHLVADIDIKCYKVVFRANKNEWFSLHMGYPYTKDKVTESTNFSLEELDKAFYLEESVFHSYINLQSTFSRVKSWKKQQNGFRYDFRILECVIPKGTPYWINEAHGEYASTRIKPVKELNNTKP